MNNVGRVTSALLILWCSLLIAQPGKNPGVNAPNAGDFFIISSVDLAKHQLLLKLPTEVTELMKVDNSTRYSDEVEKPIKLSDLRAGDTVFITSVSRPSGHFALSIRKGAMTVQLLRERYLSGKN